MAALAGAAAGLASKHREHAEIHQRKKEETPADQLIAIVNSCQTWTPPVTKATWWRRNRQTVISMMVIAGYLQLAATFYRINNGWSWGQSWFMSADVFCAIGYGSMVEGDGEPMKPDFKPWESSMAFTIVHTIMGGIMISFFLAFVILYMMEAKEQLVNKMMRDTRKMSLRDKFKLWVDEHLELVVSIGLYVIWTVVGVVGTQSFTDYSVLRSLYYSITAMSTAGLQGPDPDSATELNFCTLYSLIGTPIFALLLSVLSGLIVEYVETTKLQARLASPITEKEFNYVDEVMGMNEVDFGGFLILTLAKLGKMDDKLLQTIKDRFKFLDIDGDGRFTQMEMKLMMEFERFDKDMSGTITAPEFAKLIMNLNHKNPGSQKTDPVNILKQFREIDADGDSEIEKEEFLNWWRTVENTETNKGGGGGSGGAESSRTAIEPINTPDNKDRKRSGGRSAPRMNTYTFNTIFGPGSVKARHPPGKNGDRPAARASWAPETPRNGLPRNGVGNGNGRMGSLGDDPITAAAAAADLQRRKERARAKKLQRQRMDGKRTLSGAPRASTKTGMTQSFGEMAL